MDLILVITNGEHPSGQVPLHGRSKVTFGTDSGSDVVVPNDLVMDSRHFRIDRTQSGRIWVQDLMSKSGTTVNGERVQRTQLNLGDVVRAGGLVLEVRAGSDMTLPMKSEPIASASEIAAHDNPVTGASESAIEGTDTGLNEETLKRSLLENGITIKAEIGRGTFGCVYRGTRSSDGQDVAIKVLDGVPGESPERTKLFRREMSIHEHLDHPKIVQFTEHGSADQILAWYAMEFVDGPTLSQYVHTLQNRMALETACHISVQILSALDYAHRLPAPHGPVVHRDVKPSNILIDDANGQPIAKLCDFGLAKNFERAGLSSMTATGQSRGNIEYMSPDQATDSKYSGPEVDVYAMGGVLHFCLTGRSLYDVGDRASASEILKAKLTHRFTPIEKLRKDLPVGVQSIIDRATGRDHARRFRTAGQMLRSVEALISESEPNQNA